MAQSLRWTSRDLELLPDDGKRYEIVDGELFVAKAPSAYHQLTCTKMGTALTNWDQDAKLGQTFVGPGVIFSPDNDVIPDLAWVRRDRLAAILDDKGHFRAAPDVVVEILSPGPENEERDREAKLKLYSRRGVREYWIVDWQLHQVEVYRREGLALALVATLLDPDSLTSPLLPGFALPLAWLFADVPRTTS
jgi:Uma2 family endonuclease